MKHFTFAESLVMCVSWGSSCWGDGVWGLLPSGWSRGFLCMWGDDQCLSCGSLLLLCPVGAHTSPSSQGAVFPGQQAQVSTPACTLSPPKRLLEAQEATCQFPEVLQTQRSLWDAHAGAEAAVVPTRPQASAAKRVSVFKDCASFLPWTVS